MCKQAQGLSFILELRIGIPSVMTLFLRSVRFRMVKWRPIPGSRGGRVWSPSKYPPRRSIGTTIIPALTTIVNWVHYCPVSDPGLWDVLHFDDKSLMVFPDLTPTRLSELTWWWRAGRCSSSSWPPPWSPPPSSCPPSSRMLLVSEQGGWGWPWFCFVCKRSVFFLCN